MQGNQYVLCELLVLFFEGTSETTNYRTQNFKQLCKSVVLLLFVNDHEEQILDLDSDVLPQRHVLAVNSVQNGLKVVSFARVFGVKQLQKLNNILLGNIFGHCLVANRGRHHELQKQFVNQLQVRPCLFQVRLVLVRIR